MAKKDEIDTRWSIDDLVEANLYLDAKLAAEARAAKRLQEQQRRPS